MTRLGITMDYSDDFPTVAADVVAFEKAGADIVEVAEAYSFDAVSRLGYLAAITSTITLASGILPLYSRTPTLLAMTAAGLDSVSGGRFELGLGTSGPQVIEGFHGVPFATPLAHVRETVEICRSVWRRERVEQIRFDSTLHPERSRPGAVSSGGLVGPGELDGSAHTEQFRDGGTIAIKSVFAFGDTGWTNYVRSGGANRPRQPGAESGKPGVLVPKVAGAPAGAAGGVRRTDSQCRDGRG